jgi:PAS domain S-box-containing protein
MSNRPDEFSSPAPDLHVLGLIEDAELLAEAIVDTVSDSLLLLDADLIVRLANRSFYLNFRVRPEETLHRLVYELGDGQWDIPALRELLEDVLPLNHQFRDFEVEHDFPGIGHRIMLLNGRRLRRRTDQRELILLAIEDVTDLRIAQNGAVFAAEIMYASGDAMIGLSPDGIIQSWNRAAEDLFGYTAQEVAGRSISLLATDDERMQREQNGLLRQLMSGEPVYVETTLYRKDGNAVEVAASARPVKDRKGGIRAISAAITDMTQRRNMERALHERERSLTALLQEREALVREMHHRVKDNLQSISSLLSLQAVQANNSMVGEALTEAQRRVRTIAQIHESLYAGENLAEIEFGAYLKTLLSQVLTLYSRSNIAVEITADRILLPLEAAVPLALIASELITNSFKHAFPAERAGTISVTLSRVPHAAESTAGPDAAPVQLLVRDDGIGFPPSFSLSPGFGLDIVTLMVEQLHAQMERRNTGGAYFRITFPPPAPHASQ